MNGEEVDAERAMAALSGLRERRIVVKCVTVTAALKEKDKGQLHLHALVDAGCFAEAKKLLGLIYEPGAMVMLTVFVPDRRRT